jgi:hypothetical protein
MTDWLGQLNYDPLPPLLSSGDAALIYFAQRDLLTSPVGLLDVLWQLPEPRRIIRRQHPSGCWKYAAKGQAYDLVETFRQFRYLVEMYQMDRRVSAVAAAGEYILAHQSAEGDIRGIMANQMAAYYTGALLALLIKAGYGADPRIARGLRWLLSVRQSDGGWLEFPGLPAIDHLSPSQRNRLVTDFSLPAARSFAPEQPFSIPATGMAIRPFCLAPTFRDSPETLRAAALLKGAFFQKNRYTTYQHPDHWINFQFPFWWNNLLAALDSLSQTTLTAEDAHIRAALLWLKDHQEPGGLWAISYSAIHKSSPNSKSRGQQLWISLSIGRVLKRFSGV